MCLVACVYPFVVLHYECAPTLVYVSSFGDTLSGIEEIKLKNEDDLKNQDDLLIKTASKKKENHKKGRQSSNLKNEEDCLHFRGRFHVYPLNL